LTYLKLPLGLSTLGVMVERHFILLSAENIDGKKIQN
jgi:hypothetical protein